MSPDNKKTGIEPKVFFPPLLIVLSFCGVVAYDLDTARGVLNQIFGIITYNLGWAFEWYWILMIGLWVWFAAGPLATKKLGSGAPEFSTMTWIFLMFASGTSANVFFWLMYEHYSYISNPPFGLETLMGTADNPVPEAVAVYALDRAKELSMAFSILHWGPITWISYVPLVVAFGYFFFIKKIDVARPSATLGPLIGETRAKGLMGTIIDNIYITVFILAIGTSLGVCTPLVTETMSYLFGIERSLYLDITLVAFWIVFNAICVAFGLSSGIKKAGDVRLFFTLMLCGWIIIVGSTAFFFNYFTDSIGVFLNNLPRMLFYTDMISKSGFPQNWTIFLWAWYIVFGIQTCIFCARISKGRTVREVCFGIAFGMCISTFLVMLSFGAHTVDTLHNNPDLNAAQIVADYSRFRLIVEILGTLPFPKFGLFIFLGLCLISTLTLVNANSYTMAMSTCKSESAEAEPPVFIRILWSVIVGVIGISLVAMGSIEPMQTLLIVGGVSLYFVNLMVIWAFFKEALGPKGEWRKYVIKDDDDKKSEK